jgi:hypothetical protein
MITANHRSTLKPLCCNLLLPLGQRVESKHTRADRLLHSRIWYELAQTASGIVFASFDGETLPRVDACLSALDEPIKICMVTRMLYGDRMRGTVASMSMPSCFKTCQRIWRAFSATLGVFKPIQPPT